MGHPVIDRAYAALVDDGGDGKCRDLPEEVCADAPANAARIVGSLTLTKLGDRIVDPKTVLTWLLTSAGAPALAVGMLVPVRESGAVLPQAALVPFVRRFGRRKWVWVLGAAGQAMAVAAMAVLAATAEGAVLGWGIVAAVAVFALARSLASIASKDVLGKTIPKGHRGRVTGISASTSGLVAIAVGLGIRFLLGDRTPGPVFAWLLGTAAAAWAIGAIVFATMAEPVSDDREEGAPIWRRSVRLLRDESAFRRFVVARTLLFVTALSPPWLVVLASRRGGARLREVGVFVVAAGLGSLIGSPIWGRLADRSSRRVMTLAAAAGTALVALTLLLESWGPAASWAGTHALLYLAFMLAHAGARIGRKTYVVDLGEGDERTDHVAVSNSLIGVMLLVVGGIAGGLGGIAPQAALGFLGLLGAAGVAVSRTLPEVE
jgi:MFS family permease